MARSRPGEHKLAPVDAAREQLKKHHLLGPVACASAFIPLSRESRVCVPATTYCVIEGQGTVLYNDAVKLSESAWLGVLSLATLVLAVGGPRRLKVPGLVSDQAVQLAALHWWNILKVGELPEHFELHPDILQWGRWPLEEIAQRLRAGSFGEGLGGEWTLTRDTSVALMRPEPQDDDLIFHEDVESLFAEALVESAQRALDTQHAVSSGLKLGRRPNSPAAKAKRWLISHHPLLAPLLVQLELVEDVAVCHRMGIWMAAVHIGLGEIYINPARYLNIEHAKFVVAHEALHAGLCHGSRRHGRDPYLWNVACDFVINDWLVGMGIGSPPDGGVLFDETFRGMSADDIYLRLAADLRIRRKLSTLRGSDCDVLDPAPGRSSTDREAFYRRALMQGLDYHESSCRGQLPAALVEAIRTLNQPPIPWQAELAEWIRQRVAVPEHRRSYARASRRQSATPDIPRPRYIEPEEQRATRTFGVIIDTSGSMQRDELGNALGAVVSYSLAHDVKQVRLVYCDAAPYDAGFVDIESLTGRVSVRGRGGTVLQPAVTLLERQTDFPRRCPILIITDGECEPDLTVSYDHAFLLVPGGRLPFRTSRPTFTMS